MKAIIVTVLILVGCISIDPALAQPSKASSEAQSVEATIKQLVYDWADAMVTLDADKVSKIIADDWTEGYPGKIITKANFIDNIKSHKLESYEFGPVDVKVLGDVAVIKGSISETMIKDGQPTTIRVSFMDVFAKRGGKWVAVRSHSKKL